MSAFSERAVLLFFVWAFAALALYTATVAPPSPYPSGSVVNIPAGTTVGGAAAILAQEKAIRWPLLFEVLVRAGSGSVYAGPYYLAHPENVITLAFRFSHGKSELTSARVTIPEGSSVREAAEILQKNLGAFDSAKFLALAKPDEGYLFPDTYFFLPGTAPEAVIAQMQENFDARTKPLEKDIEAFGRPTSDVIIMASILEKEARQAETRRIVAGILWKRLKLGMPLQVDATFGYIFGKDTYSPAGADLDVDSPYNTYKYKGLPPGPIGNPGIEAIEDAVTPIATPYLYYVTDKEGNIYYAKTFQEHLQNIQKANSK